MQRIRARVRVGAVAAAMAAVIGCYMLEHEGRGGDMHRHQFSDLSASDTLETYYCRVPGCATVDTVWIVNGRHTHVRPKR